MTPEPLARSSLEAIKRRWKECGPGWDVWVLVSEVERLWADRIAWSDADGYDPAYGHDWSRDDGACAACGIEPSAVDGGPCPTKADLVAFYAPRPVNPLAPLELTRST